MDRRQCIAYFMFVVAAATSLSSCKRREMIAVYDPTALNIMCVGDSITAGTHGQGDSGSESYPGLLKDALSEMPRPCYIVNKGENGWTILDVEAHIANWVTPNAPDIILLQIGTNDIEQNATPVVAAQRLSDLLKKMITLAPRTRIYVASVTRVRDPNAPNLPPETAQDFNALIPDVVAALRSTDAHIRFVDLYKRSGMNDEDFGPDGEHPNDSGYEKMADFWLATLKHYEAGQLKPRIAPGVVAPGT